MTRSELAAMIDHTLLKPGATDAHVDALCREALEHCFRTVCVNPCRVRRAADLLGASAVGVCSVAGFPLGASVPGVKAAEAARAVQDGATEVDMVANVGALLSGDTALVGEDIADVVAASQGQVVKVIIEAALLDDEQKALVCGIAVDSGAGFVKTSTGFGPGGATIEDVRLMRTTVGEAVGVKAAGGIRTYEQAIGMIEAGASRIGASSSVAILEGADEK